MKIFKKVIMKKPQQLTQFGMSKVVSMGQKLSILETHSQDYIPHGVINFVSTHLSTKMQLTDYSKVPGTSLKRI